MGQLDVLKQLGEYLDRAAEAEGETSYRLPKLWLSVRELEDGVDGYPVGEEVVISRPVAFFASRVREIVEGPRRPLTAPPEGGDWTSVAAAYTLLVRMATAWDHDGDGVLGGANGDISLNAQGQRETGTFLKTILLLPLLRHMGIDTIHLLPVTRVGCLSRKGELGSIYAMKDPYRCDDFLADPLVADSGLDADQQLRALIEAAHHLGFRVVSEFILRTASVDSDWIWTFPHWFYWVYTDREFRMPQMYRPGQEYLIVDGQGRRHGRYVFSSHEEWLRWFDSYSGFKGFVHERGYVVEDLPRLGETDPEYLELYAPPPPRHTLRLKGGRIVGESEGRAVTIAPAFVDNPFDLIQPPWPDVTYLRLYHDPGGQAPLDLNHVGYDTAKFLYFSPQAEKEVAPWRNEELWDRIEGVVPYFQAFFAMNGVLIDMGHALPLALKERIRDRALKLDPAFAFWDESVEAITLYREFNFGYQAFSGNLYIYVAEGLKGARQFLSLVEGKRFGGKMLGAPEIHNTKRVAALAPPGAERPFCLAMTALAIWTPCLAPNVLNGLELMEKEPINTGMGFTPGEVARYAENNPEAGPDAPRLGLFSRASLGWLSPDLLIGEIARSLKARRDPEVLALWAQGAAVYPYDVHNPQVLAYCTAEPDRPNLVVAINFDLAAPQQGRIYTTRGGWILPPAAEGQERDSHGGRSFRLEPGQAAVWKG